MKRLISLIVVAIIALIMIAVPVLAAGYTATISVSNTASAYNYPPVMIPQDNSYLASNGFISSTGEDVNVDSGSTSLPLMLTDKQTWFVPSSLPIGNSSFTWSAGNTPTSKQIIVGTDGIISTPYNASLEPGSSSWELDIPGYIDTSLAVANAGAEVFDHISEFYIQVTGANELTAGVVDNVGYHSIVLTGVPSGYYSTQSLIDDAGTLTYTISGVSGTYTGTASGTIGTIPDLSEPWIWDTFNAMPYIDYIKLSIGSTVFNLSTSTQIGIPSGNMVPIPNSMCQDSSYLYVLAADSLMNNDVSILKIDKTTGSQVAHLDFSNYYDFTYQDIDHSRLMTIDNGYLFLIEPNSSSGAGASVNIDKIATSDFSIDPTVQTLSGCISIDSDGTYIYVARTNGGGGGGEYCELDKILESNMLISATGSSFDLFSGSIVCGDSNVYVRGTVGAGGTGANKIATFAKSDLSELDLSGSTNLSINTSLDYQGGVIYGIFHDNVGYPHNGIYAYAVAVPLVQTGSWGSGSSEFIESICSDSNYLYASSQTGIYQVDIGTLVTTTSGSLSDNTSSNIIVGTSDLYNTDIVSSLPKIRDFTCALSPVLLYQPNTILATSTSTYNTGTVTLTTGSTTVTGDGSGTFTSNMQGGQIEGNTDGVYYTIQSVNSATSLTLNTAYTQTGGSGLSYTLNYYPTATLPNLDDGTHATDGTITFGTNIGSGTSSGVWGNTNNLIPPLNPKFGVTTTSAIDLANVPYNQGGQIATYTNGTALFQNGSDTVIGSSTVWISSMAGGYIKDNIDGVYYQIQSVTSSNHLTLVTPYSDTGGSSAYTMEYLSGGTSSEDVLQSNNIFTPWWQPWANISNIPLITFFLFIGTAFLIYVVVIVLKFTQNQFIAGFIMLLGEAFLYKLGIYQFWFVIVSGLIIGALVVFERKPAL